MQTISFFLPVVLILTATASPLLRAANQDDDRLKAILTAMEAREQQRAPVRMKYRVDQHLGTPFFLGASQPKTDTARSVDIAINAEVALKGPRVYVKRDGPLPSDSPRKSTPNQVWVWVFDGKNTRQIMNGEYMTSSQALQRRFETPWDICGERIVLTDFRIWRDGGFEKNNTVVQCAVTDERGPDGKALVRLAWSASNGRKFTWWLLPEYDYAIHRVERFDETGQLSFLVDQCTYEVIGKTAYPRTAVKTTFSKLKQGNQPIITMRDRLTVQSIETDPGHIPDSLFVLDIPKDASVIDLDTNTRIVDPDAVQEHLNKLANEIPGRRSKRWWPAIVTFSVLAIVLTGVAFWWRKRRPSA